MITNLVREDGSVAEYTYDGLDRLVRERHIGGEQAGSDVHLGYDLVGNRMSKSNGNVVVTYSHSNGCNRLLGWSAQSSDDFATLRRGEPAGDSAVHELPNAA